MTSGQKIAFSLLITLLLFTGFMLTIKTAVFDELETRFYAQSKIHQNVEHLNALSESTDTYITNVLYLIEKSDASYLKSPSVRSYYLQNPSEKDVSARRQLTEELFRSVPALNGIRIIDKNARTVHFSTFDETDVLKQSGITKFYKYYNDIQKDASEIPFETIARAASETDATVLFDESKNRLILAVPFFWVDDLYSGLALFYLNIRDIERALGVQGVMDVGESFTLFSDSEDLQGGFAVDVPGKIKEELGNELKKLWKNTPAAASTNSVTATASAKISALGDNLEIQFPTKLLQMDDGRFWVCLSDTKHTFVQVAGIYTSDMFEISGELELAIYTALFITAFLVLFLFFSLWGEPVSRMKKRVKKMQYALVSDFIESKDKIEWENAVTQLRSTKEDMSAQILKGFRVHSKKKKKELSEYLNASWNEIIAAMESRADDSKSAPREGLSSQASAGGSTAGNQEMMTEIRSLMDKVLFEVRSARGGAENGAVRSSGSAGALAGSGTGVGEASRAVGTGVQNAAHVAADAAAFQNVPFVAATEIPDMALSNVDDLAYEEELLDEVEELDDAEELDEVEEPDEVEELDDAEELADAEEVPDEVEELDDAEEVPDDVENLEDAGALAEAEEIDDVEELDEAEELGEVEELDEVESLDEVEELDDAEVLDEAENLDDAEEVLGEAEEPSELEEPSATEEASSGQPEISPAMLESLDVPDILLEESDNPKFDDSLYDLYPDSETLPVEAFLSAAPADSISEFISLADALNAAVSEADMFSEPLGLGIIDTTPQNAQVAINAQKFKVYDLESDFDNADDISVALSVSEPETANDSDDIIDDVIEEEPIFPDLEELPGANSSGYFSMTGFLNTPQFFDSSSASQLQETEPPQTVGASHADTPQQTIVENDGVYSITTEELEYSDVLQDPAFKALVDSVLRK